jgi:hypothetical protein
VALEGIGESLQSQEGRFRRISRKSGHGPNMAFFRIQNVGRLIILKKEEKRAQRARANRFLQFFSNLLSVFVVHPW